MNVPKLLSALMAAFLVPMIWSWGFYEGTKKYSCTMSVRGGSELF